MDNRFPVRAVIIDAEPHLFKFWDSGDVRNPFLVEPTLNRKKTSILVSGSVPCVSISKHLVVSFHRFSGELLTVHLVVCGADVQVDHGRV